MGEEKESSSSSPDDFKSKSIFEAMERAMMAADGGGEKILKRIRGIYLFKIKNSSGKEGSWLVNAKDGTGSVQFNGKSTPECTITISDEDFVNLMEGKLKPQKAFLQGKLKIQGNMGLAMKLQEFRKTISLKSKL